MPDHKLIMFPRVETRPVHITDPGKARRYEAAVERTRVKCSTCNRPGEWYEFEPGSGRCDNCTT